MIKKSMVSAVLALSLISSSVVHADDSEVTIFGITLSGGWALILAGSVTESTANVPALKGTATGQVLDVVGGVIGFAGTLVTMGTVKSKGEFKIASLFTGAEAQKAIARECRVLSKNPALAAHSPLSSLANNFEMFRSQSQADRMKSSCDMMNSIAAHVNALHSENKTNYDESYAKEITGNNGLTPNDARVIRNLYYVYGLTPDQA